MLTAMIWGLSRCFGHLFALVFAYEGAASYVFIFLPSWSATITI